MARLTPGTPTEERSDEGSPLVEKYRERIHKQRKKLEEFATHEIEWADDLLLWYKVRKEEIPDDEYRVVAFFKNREWLLKPGSLTLLYSMNQRLYRELPAVTKETAFYHLCYRFKVYAAALQEEGY